MGRSSVTLSQPGEFYDQFGDVLRVIRSLTEDAYAECDLGIAQAKLIRHIGMNSRVSQAEVARATHTAPSLTGRVLAALIARGWVRRTRSGTDLREYVVELTAKGQQVRARVDKARAGVSRQLARVLDDKDARDFARIADKLLHAFAGTGE